VTHDKTNSFETILRRSWQEKARFARVDDSSANVNMAKEITNFEQLKLTTLGWFKEGADDGWTYTEGYPGSVCSQKHMNPWPIDSFRVSGEVPKSPKDAADTLWSWKTEDW
jgi:hypothetical protein